MDVPGKKAVSRATRERHVLIIALNNIEYLLATGIKS